MLLINASFAKVGAGKTINSYGRKCRLSHVVDLRHVKDP